MAFYEKESHNVEDKPMRNIMINITNLKEYRKKLKEILKLRHISNIFTLLTIWNKNKGK